MRRRRNLAGKCLRVCEGMCSQLYATVARTNLFSLQLLQVSFDAQVLRGVLNCTLPIEIYHNGPKEVSSQTKAVFSVWLALHMSPDHNRLCLSAPLWTLSRWLYRNLLM